MATTFVAQASAGAAANRGALAPPPAPMPTPMRAAAPRGAAQQEATQGSRLVALASAGLLGATAAVGRRRKLRQAPRGARAVRAVQLKETTASLRAPDVSKLPRSSKENVMVLAQEAGIKLEVRPWEMLSGIAKDAARGWFFHRAEERGIGWSRSVARFQAQQADLEHLFDEIADPNLEYPAYYTLPFHGYDEGNLSWLAAHELEAATQSMCLGYYGLSWQDSQEMYRGAARDTIKEYWHSVCGDQYDEDGAAELPESILDIGCSGGFSTHEMSKSFPGAKVTGMDLSPYFLSVAKFTYPEHNLVHGMAEEIGMPDNSFDMVAFNFLLHELPLDVSRRALREAARVLRPGGLVAVLDVDPRRLLELPPLRRWAFQVTEPWCKDGEYYSLNLEKELVDVGFDQVRFMSNDPVNALVFARKSD